MNALERSRRPHQHLVCGAQWGGGLPVSDRHCGLPRVLPQLRATMLLQWVLERLPQVNVLLCSESRLFFLSPQDLADPRTSRHPPSLYLYGPGSCPLLSLAEASLCWRPGPFWSGWRAGLWTTVSWR